MPRCQSKLAEIRIHAADWPVVNDIRLGADENHVLNVLHNHGARLAEGEQQNHSRLLRFFQIRKHLIVTKIFDFYIHRHRRRECIEGIVQNDHGTLR